MKELTRRQEEFLLIFAINTGLHHQLTNAATYFDVKKSSVSQVVKCLTAARLIERNDTGLCLTAQGHEYIAEKLEQWKWVSLWMTSQFGMEPLTAERDACIMVCRVSKDAVKHIVATCKKEVPIPQPTDPERVVSEQTVPFSIYKKNSISLSMGDNGFIKPATILDDGDKAWVVLEPRTIRYAPAKHHARTGSLHRLWYAHNRVWHEVALVPPGVYRIPVSAFKIDTEEQRATLRIRARATVGIFSMPESEALLTLDCSNLKLT